MESFVFVSYIRAKIPIANLSFHSIHHSDFQTNYKHLLSLITVKWISAFEEISYLYLYLLLIKAKSFYSSKVIIFSY